MVLVGWTFAVTGDFFLLRKTWCDGTLSFGGVNGPYIDILWLKQCHNHPFGNGLYMFIPSICGDLGDVFLLFHQHYTYIHAYIHTYIHTSIYIYSRSCLRNRCSGRHSWTFCKCWILGYVFRVCNPVNQPWSTGATTPVEMIATEFTESQKQCLGLPNYSPFGSQHIEFQQ